MKNSRVTVPSFHTRPLIRLDKPMVINSPDNHPTSEMRNYHFKNVITREMRRSFELVYDPNMSLRSHGPRFSADFESGNLGQVYKIGNRAYEIHLLPDPTRYYSALWYFFKVENLKPGEYFFAIVGFFRDCHLHNLGVQPTAYSEYDARNGIGWQRIGYDLNFWTWKHSIVPEYALSFKFVVTHTDNMYFSYLYPYTYSELHNWFSRNKKSFTHSVLCKSAGGLDVPAVFWDADEQKCINIQALPRSSVRGGKKKPLIVIAARLHPGESNSSYAMEGLMSYLTENTNEASQLLKKFSWLLLPMINPDGVVCGYYRPQLYGYDINRVWKSPDRVKQPVAYAVVQLLDELTKTRPLMFLLDFHGHTAQCNAFTYGVHNPNVRLNEYERLFPKIMGQICSVFDEKESATMLPRDFPTTMRVALHHRYHIPFAYTLEMSFGGINLGPERSTQMTPHHYRYVGQMTAATILQMFSHFLQPFSVESLIPSTARRCENE